MMLHATARSYKHSKDTKASDTKAKSGESYVYTSADYSKGKYYRAL